jgi:arylsulfatase A-like enzyme
MASPEDPGRSLLARSCIHGGWKLIEWSETLPENGRQEGKKRKNPDSREELFDLAADRGETRNLAAKQPERVKELAARLEGWWKPSARPNGG